MPSSIGSMPRSPRQHQRYPHELNARSWTRRAERAEPHDRKRPVERALIDCKDVLLQPGKMCVFVD
jgi:hypothetical protein